ncbi:hypothetical protein [Sporichthya sp.]|uniref:hypothetical protein n=1 Tax=Sporichthya sp. TaxID=65475 RepID=UPI00185329CE|nr:hypothetical protein [Sporichthya sp.]MBA3741572.1 hypothetical protein [Sporichthya sp.]
MSIPVAIADLPATIAKYDLSFLVSVSAAGQPRFLAQRPRVDEGADGPMLVVDKAGAGTQKAADGQIVALLYPNADATKHSLIVDGTAELRGTELWITPTAAILHIPR